jgi:cysteinyl-tRNA synthetase
MMQAHYRSTLDFTEDSLNAAEKGYTRLSDALALLDKLTVSASSSFNVQELADSFYAAMDDDFNAPILIANLFEAVRRVNLINDGNDTISASDLELLKQEMHSFVSDVLGLHVGVANSDAKLAPVMELVLDLRQQARENKDWTTSDRIRDGLAAAGITVKDSKEGTNWS